MSDPARLLRAARERAGLSQRALAELARVSASTVTRIERGEMDPTIGMLRRLLAAAGVELSLEAASTDQQPELALLTDAWTRTSDGDRPDWTRLRGLLDEVLAHPDRISTAIARRPKPTGSTVMDALLAGIADKLADDAGLPRPDWTRRGRRLREPWFTPATPRQRQSQIDHTPPQLRERNIIVDQASLWRDRQAAHV